MPLTVRLESLWCDGLSAPVRSKGFPTVLRWPNSFGYRFRTSEGYHLRIRSIHAVAKQECEDNLPSANYGRAGDRFQSRLSVMACRKTRFSAAKLIKITS